MSISIAFHKNISLLLQAVPPSYDFKKHYREGMFEKPNTTGFTYVSHYILSIYDPDHVKKNIEWPVLCKKSEAKYRNDVKEFLILISHDNPDIGFPSIVPSLLLRPGGTKFIKVMWKLSQVALREYIKRQSEHEVLFAPKLGSTEELAKTLIKNIINNTSDSNSKIHETLIKKEEEAKKYAEEEKAKIVSTQKDIFEELQIVGSLAAEAPVHPSFQKRLLDCDDEEIIQMWKTDIRKSVSYFRNKVQLLKTSENDSKTAFSMASNMISESAVLNANCLPRIDINEISELLFSKTRVSVQHVYKNGNLNLLNYFVLLSIIADHCRQYIISNGFLDFSHCYPQLEASCSDLKKMNEVFHELHSKMTQFSSEVQQKVYLPPSLEYDNNESLNMASDLKTVMFMPSPPIQFNSNTDGRNEMQNKLKLTPVEGVHKQLFLRYNKNKDNLMKNASRLKPNLTVTRINFDDTICSEISERQSPCRRFIPPKTIWSTCKPVGKYSRLFSNRLIQPINKAANCSILSIPCTSKANSTVMNNIVDGNNAELTIDITMKNLFSYSSDSSVTEKKSPKKSNRFFNMPDINVDVNQQCLNVNEEIETKFIKPCSPGPSPIKYNSKKGRRRSISDLVERYKRIVEKSTTNAVQLESVLDSNITEES